MQNLVITGKGQELTAQLIAGISTATFTKIATSSYDYSSSTLEDVTELYDIKQTALVSKVSKTGTTIVEVLAKVDNTNLESGYYIKALGLYAKGSDGIEILFGVSIETDHPDYMPPQNGTAVSGISYRLNTKVDNSSQVTIEVNPAASPTMEQVETLERVINSHSKMDVCSSEGVHGFRYYNDALQVKNEKEVWINTETGEKLEKSEIIDDLDTALAVTEDKVPVGCKAIQVLNSNLNNSLSEIDVRYNAESRIPEWSPRGADTWSPFSSSRFEFVSGVTRNSFDSIDFVIPEDGNYILVVQVSSAGTLAENYAKVQKLTLNGTTYKYTGAEASQACNANSYYNIMIWYSLFGVKAGKGHIADTSHSLLGGQLFKI